MSETKTVVRNRLNLKLRIVVLVAALAVAGGWWLSRPAELPDGVSPAEYKQAKLRFLKMYRRNPGRIDVLSLAGELAVGEGRWATAVACFREVPSRDPKYGASARLQEGQVLLRLNRAHDAEQSFREFLSLAERIPSVPDEHVAVARKWLAYLLSVELRLEERKDLLADMHADGRADVFDSKQCYFPNLLLWHTSTGRRRLTEFLKEDPANRVLRLAEGRYLTAEGRLDEAQALLEELRADRQNDLEIAAALLECLFERNDWREFAVVAKSLPGYRPGEPWLLTRMRGEFAVHVGDWQAAVNHFEHVLEADRANPWCQMGLARAFAELKQPQARDEAQRRSLVLSRIRVSLVTVKDDDYHAALELASKCEQIGLREAAETFRQHASRIQSASAKSTEE